MKALLEFDLDEPSDREAHLRCIKNLDIALALNDILEYLRMMIKHSDDETTEETYVAVQNKVTDILDEYGLNLDELIS